MSTILEKQRRSSRLLRLEKESHPPSTNPPPLVHPLHARLDLVGLASLILNHIIRPSFPSFDEHHPPIYSRHPPGPQISPGSFCICTPRDSLRLDGSSRADQRVHPRTPFSVQIIQWRGCGEPESSHFRRLRMIHDSPEVQIRLDSLLEGISAPESRPSSAGFTRVGDFPCRMVIGQDGTHERLIGLLVNYRTFGIYRLLEDPIYKYSIPEIRISVCIYIYIFISYPPDHSTKSKQGSY